MNTDVLRALADRFALLAAVNHLALAVIAAVLWQRRKGIERTLAVYFAATFMTAAACLATRPETRVYAAVAAVVAALWVAEIVRPRAVIELGRVPRARTVVSALAGLFAFAYPGYTEELPAFVFAPLGVILAPTLVAALATANLAPPRSSGRLHWTMVVAGAAVGARGLVAGDWAHAPLVALSAYGAALLLGRATMRPREHDGQDVSVRQIRERMYARKTLLPGPRDPRRRINIRRKR